MVQKHDLFLHKSRKFEFPRVILTLACKKRSKCSFQVRKYVIFSAVWFCKGIYGFAYLKQIKFNEIQSKLHALFSNGINWCKAAKIGHAKADHLEHDFCVC